MLKQYFNMALICIHIIIYTPIIYIVYVLRNALINIWPTDMLLLIYRLK